MKCEVKIIGKPKLPNQPDFCLNQMTTLSLCVTLLCQAVSALSSQHSRVPIFFAGTDGGIQILMGSSAQKYGKLMISFSSNILISFSIVQSFGLYFIIVIVGAVARGTLIANCQQIWFFRFQNDSSKLPTDLVLSILKRLKQITNKFSPPAYQNRTIFFQISI